MWFVKSVFVIIVNSDYKLESSNIFRRTFIEIKRTESVGLNTLITQIAMNLNLANSR